MSFKPLFSGLIFDEEDKPVKVTYVGSEPFYVVDDSGFKRHIPTEQVDRQVLNLMRQFIQGHEKIISEQTATMLGQDDIFTKAMIETQLKNIEKHFNKLMETGIPEEGRAYLGMMGLKIRINLHGEVIEFTQPGRIETGEE